VKEQTAVENMKISKYRK